MKLGLAEVIVSMDLFCERLEPLVGCLTYDGAGKLLVHGKLLFDGTPAVAKFFLGVAFSTGYIWVSYDLISTEIFKCRLVLMNSFEFLRCIHP